MAFTAGKSKEIEGKSNDWLLDQSLMQSMQDRFCDANNVYMVCLNAQNGVVTKAYGTKEELEYVYSKAGRERHVSLLDKMTGHSIESVVEEPLDTDFIKMSGVAIHGALLQIVGVFRVTLKTDFCSKNGGSVSTGSF